jgi:DNA-directed RNA polymerase specialized sigma subunit
LDVTIAKKRVLLEELESQAVYRTMAFNVAPVSHSVNPHSGESRIVRMMDLKTQLQDDICCWIELRRKALSVIDSLDDWMMCMILYYYYLDHRTLFDVADVVGISYQWTHALLKRSLSKLSTQEVSSTGT